MPACSRLVSAAIVWLAAFGAVAREDSTEGYPAEDDLVVVVDAAKDAKSRPGCSTGFMKIGDLCAMRPPLMRDVWLKYHNIYRCVHNASYLKWYEPAAQSAQQWADSLESLQHSKCYDEPPPVGPAGENLARGFSPLGAACNGWYEEVDGCSWPRCREAGHFTPMVWQGVTQLGCGRNEELMIDVCRYRSGDKPKSCALPNTIGCYEWQVQPAVKSLQRCVRQVELHMAAPWLSGRSHMLLL